MQASQTSRHVRAGWGNTQACSGKLGNHAEKLAWGRLDRIADMTYGRGRQVDMSDKRTDVEAGRQTGQAIGKQTRRNGEGRQDLPRKRWSHRRVHQLDLLGEARGFANLLDAPAPGVNLPRPTSQTTVSGLEPWPAHLQARSATVELRVLINPYLNYILV
jgi:hypothetical protein